MMPPQKQLSHTLKRRHIAMISLGGIIGAGLFVGSSSAIVSTGPAAVLSYVLAGALVFLIMRMLGEMATTFPQIGTFTEYIRLALGDWAGFSSGWLYWYFWVIVVAVETIAGATIIAQWWHVPVWLIALGLLAAMMCVNAMSVKSYGEFEYWFSSLKVGAIVVFIGGCLVYVAGVHAGEARHFANLTAAGGFMPHGFGAVLGAVPVVIFSIAGAEVATIAAAESAEPAKNIASITRSIVIRVLTFYVLSILLIVAIVPWNQITLGFSPFVTALERMHVTGAAMMMNILILVAVLSCLNSGLYVSSRVLFELSCRGDAPSGLMAVNRRAVPLKAILASCLFGFVAILLSFKAPAGVFRFLIDASGCIMLVIYLLVALAQTTLRRRSTTPKAAPGSEVWLFPWLSYAAVMGIAATLVAMAWNPAMRSQVLSSAVAFAITLGIFFVLARSKRRAMGQQRAAGNETFSESTETGI
jgi:AAT family amino acid transporter/GABA permease